MPLESAQVAGGAALKPGSLARQQPAQRIDVSLFPILPAEGDLRGIKPVRQISIKIFRIVGTAGWRSLDGRLTGGRDEGLWGLIGASGGVGR